MTQIVMEMPTKDTPGFLKRSKTALSFQTRLKQGEADPSIFDEMVEFLLPMVKEPKDREEARALLWDASENEFEKALSALSGTNPTKAESLRPSESSTSQA